MNWSNNYSQQIYTSLYNYENFTSTKKRTPTNFSTVFRESYPAEYLSLTVKVNMLALLWI